MPLASYDQLIEKGENPIHVIRLAQGLSIRQAAEKIGCHYQTVYMVEHAMCDTVFPVVLWWAAANSDYTFDQIEDAFALFRGKKRQLAREKFSLGKLPVEALGIPGTNPIRSLRQYLGLTTSGFCKELCLPVARLQSAEKAKFFQAAMWMSLRDLGVSHDLRLEIEERYDLL